MTKNLVYAHKIENVQHLQQVISDEMIKHIDADLCLRICRSVPSRLARLLDPEINGGQFEHIDK